MGREITGLLFMAAGGFLLMFAIAGKEFEIVYRIIPFMIGIIYFFYGVQIFRRSLTNVTMNTKDFLTIFLSILTPFIVLILIDLLGLMYGGIGIIIWVGLVSIILWKWERIFDMILPKMERSAYEKREEVRRMLNPRLYSYRTEKKKEKR